MLIPTACTLTCSFFFFNDTATTEIYTLSLHDALPISNRFNVYRAAQVIGASAPGYSSSQAMAALEEVAKRELPPEISYDWADLSYQEKKAAGTTATTFGLSLVFVFLILAALYESWSLPF